MARKKQPPRSRLQVQMSQDIYDAVSDFADLTGRSRSAVAEEILTEAVPALFQITKAVERLQLSPASGIRELAGMMDRLSWEARQTNLDLENDLSEGKYGDE